ncbi:hypothetical protein LELG_04679 [Lodderomyces elongisporus NRRL YB-4239]|uniref:Proteasome-interacting protein CIC1 n=1 Tax=Lodderomyces elongisporus (strain ATCC 11503 / CBS 2605 / JCM 1781 / NBRC 1676 / NRRL YB-4239) TaxID=379508 RepID=A5E4Z0_LODEL|nr:hypothetical protein LELG_04679 [Lodderomyces elongisporus NRRL YB-4239]
MAKTRSKGPVSPAANKVVKPVKAKSSKTKAKRITEPKEEVEEQKSESSSTPSANQIPEKVPLKALSELAKFIKREQEAKADKSQKEVNGDGKKLQLFEEDDEIPSDLFLIVESKKFFSSKPQFKPKTIKLTKPIYNTTDTKTCLIVRDELVKNNEDIEKLEGENLSTLENIIPFSLLKTEFKAYEKRRDLHAQYDLFIVDDAVLNSMPNLLGKVFYQSNKVPVPVRVTNSSNNKQLSLPTLKNQLEKVLSSTVYVPPQGTVVSIKVGQLDAKELHQELARNIENIVGAFDLNTVKSIMLKTTTSPALPLFYTDKLFDEEDVVREEESTSEAEAVKSVVPKKELAFEASLAELADSETIAKVLGKKLREEKQEKKKDIKGKVGKSKK